MEIRNKVVLLVILSVGFASCFIDIENNIHDNPITVGDTCDVIRSSFASDAGSKCDGSADAGSCQEDDGAPCETNADCTSNLCLCQICIDPSQFL